MHLRRSVTTPSGTEWTIGRVWATRPKPRWRRVNAEGAVSEAASITPMPDGGLEELGGWIVIVVGSIVFAVILIPLLLFGIELIVLGFLIALGILGRAFFRRPRIVKATAADGCVEHTWKVVGMWRSHKVICEIADALASGTSARVERGQWSPARAP